MLLLDYDCLILCLEGDRSSDKDSGHADAG